MKLKVVAIILSILLISLLFFIGFKKISPNKSKAQSTNIEQLDILRYLVAQYLYFVPYFY